MNSEKRNDVKFLTPVSQKDMNEEFSREVVSGLCDSKIKRLSSKYLYDDEGSRLFTEIMKLEGYYVTAKERSILQKDGKKIAEEILTEAGASKLSVMELGCGTGEKTKELIKSLQQKKVELDFFAMDISLKALLYCSDALCFDCEAMGGNYYSLQADYLEGIQWVLKNYSRRNLLLFLGASLGNFSYEESIAFLKKVCSYLNKGDFFLIGLDLKKDPRLLEAAYDDPTGVTAAFNLNILTRINRDFDADFNVKDFVHHAYYDPISYSMQSFIISHRAQTVHIRSLGVKVSFEAFESIFLERSMKFSRKDVRNLARESGFEIVSDFQDDEGFFLNSLWRVQ